MVKSPGMVKENQPYLLVTNFRCFGRIRFNQEEKSNCREKIMADMNGRLGSPDIERINCSSSIDGSVKVTGFLSKDSTVTGFAYEKDPDGTGAVAIAETTFASTIQSKNTRANLGTEAGDKAVASISPYINKCGFTP
jgi:hypothetical protein